eukprot:5304-Heterococcus_DN1.PRE.1
MTRASEPATASPARSIRHAQLLLPASAQRAVQSVQVPECALTDSKSRCIRHQNHSLSNDWAPALRRAALSTSPSHGPAATACATAAADSCLA